MLLSGVLFVLFLAGCWLYCLTDAVLTPKWEYRSRLAKSTWIYLIAATFIVGSVAWLIARRSWRNRSRVSASAGRRTQAGRAAWDFTWYPASAADAGPARHPAGRSRQASPGRGTLPKGPDDDPEFLRHLDSRIRGTSTDPGELSGREGGLREALSVDPRHLKPTGRVISGGLSARPTDTLRHIGPWRTWTPCCARAAGRIEQPIPVVGHLCITFRPFSAA